MLPSEFLEKMYKSDVQIFQVSGPQSSMRKSINKEPPTVRK